MENPPDLSPLHKELLITLMQGAESTLLLVEMLTAPRATVYHQLPPERSEDIVLKALLELRAAGFVQSQAWQNVPASEVDAGIPELRERREQVIWWRLTEQGKTAATRAVRDARSSKQTQ